MTKRLSAAGLGVMLALTLAAPSAQADPYWQCVTFARYVSGINLFGDAWTWWTQALGKYERGQAPQAGAVLVFKPDGRMRHGHVAVVSQVLTDRIIQISHANWSPAAGERGKVEENVTAIDVSPKGDWSQVKVWYGPVRDMGATVYNAYGFIYQSGVDAGRKAAQARYAQMGLSPEGLPAY